MDNSTVKINFDELQALINCIQNNKAKIFNGYGAFSRALGDLQQSGLIEGSAYNALITQSSKISKLGEEFDVYTGALINNLNKLMENQKQTEEQAALQYEELTMVDPSSFNGGTIGGVGQTNT